MIHFGGKGDLEARLGRLAWGLVIVWTALVGASLLWNFHQVWQTALELARTEAQLSYNKDLAYRLWAAGNGGVYVPATPQTPPNPYLAHVEERDIQTPSGRALTLVNPAYMTRQVHELASRLYGVRGHLTSLKPLRPENAPDDWEAKALEAFEAGAAEVMEVVVLAGEPHMRLMRPWRTEKACLKCHAAQGYKEGDIRGGISVAANLKPYLAGVRAMTFPLAAGHGLIWMLGLAGIFLGERRIREHLTERQRAEEALRQALAVARRRQREIAALLEATRAILGPGDFSQAARAIYDDCKELLGAAAGYVSLCTEEGSQNEPMFLDSGGMLCSVDPELPMPMRGLRAEAYHQGRPVYHNDFPHSDYVKYLPPGHSALENVLFAPMVIHGRVVGMLGLANKTEDFTDHDARVAAGFGELAAVAFLKKEAEEATERLIRELETERAKLQAIIESAPLGIQVADEQGRLQLANPAFEELFFRPLPEASGSSQIFDYCLPDGRPCHYQEQPIIKSYVTGEPCRNEEISAIWPDGMRKDLLINTAAIVSRDGRIAGAVGTYQDITPVKQAEREIRQLNEELQEKIDELSRRTAQLEAANKELEAFSYSVSHDLRSPVRAIEGFSRMLREDYRDRLDAEGHRLLGIIGSNAKVMGELIDDLLALSRLGRQELRYGDLDLEAQAWEVFRELKEREPRRRLDLVVNQPLPGGWGDRNLITQVLVNLLDNAVKFTRPRENAIIEVGGWTEGEENVYYVKDNGVGFDERYADKLFGVFHRLHRAEEFEGTGVGLAIVHRVVNRHGGRVWATGRVDEGAAIYFTLPRKGAPN